MVAAGSNPRRNRFKVCQGQKEYGNSRRDIGLVHEKKGKGKDHGRMKQQDGKKMEFRRVRKRINYAKRNVHVSKVEAPHATAGSDFILAEKEKAQGTTITAMRLKSRG